MPKRRVYLQSVENTITKDKANSYLKENVFDTSDFAIHVERTANKLDIDQEIVRDVLVSYWTNIFYLLNTVQKVNLKINIYGFFSLLYMKGKNLYIKKKNYEQF